MPSTAILTTIRTIFRFPCSSFARTISQAAKQTLLKGQTHIPGSGKILWGLGLASALEGNTEGAAERFEHAVEILPEWPGSYSTLGVFYFQTGQIDKAREVLDRFKNSNAGVALMSTGSNKYWRRLRQSLPLAMRPCRLRGGSNCFNSHFSSQTRPCEDVSAGQPACSFRDARPSCTQG